MSGIYIYRDIEKITCSCGGEVEEVETTEEEDKEYGCLRKRCCARAFKCKRCKVRWFLIYVLQKWNKED